MEKVNLDFFADHQICFDISVATVKELSSTTRNMQKTSAEESEKQTYETENN
jgi:hypothetical protein